MQDGFSLIVPLVYFYGYTSLKDNESLFLESIRMLSEKVSERLYCDPEANISGLLIDSCISDASSCSLIPHIVNAFDVVFIIKAP